MNVWNFKRRRCRKHVIIFFIFTFGIHVHVGLYVKRMTQWTKAYVFLFWMNVNSVYGHFWSDFATSKTWKRCKKSFLTHPRTGFIFRRIKSLFHHSNWQHIFLISFNGTSKRGVMHYNKKNKQIIWFFCQTLPICMKIVEFQSLKALPIWRFLDNFSLEKSCDRLVHWTVINIGSNRRGNFSLSVELSSFIFLLLYHELWVMIRNVHVLWTLCVDGLT